MQDSDDTLAMRETLHYVMTSDIPAHHKKILIEVITTVLRTDETERRLAALRPGDEPWMPHEAESAKVFLSGRIARSWQHADEIVMRLADQLHRRPADVRKKAIELGYGISVDFRQARASTAAGEE